MESVGKFPHKLRVVGLGGIVSGCFQLVDFHVEGEKLGDDLIGRHDGGLECLRGEALGIGRKPGPE